MTLHLTKSYYMLANFRRKMRDENVDGEKLHQHKSSTSGVGSY